jgi:hypothetical protein
MHNPGLIKTFVADGEIIMDRFVAIGSDGKVSQADSDSKYIVGVTDRLGCDDGDCIDVVLSGIVEVKAGGSITAPALVTSSANGEAVTATGGDQVVGLAITSASSGEVVSVLLGFTPVSMVSEDTSGSETPSGGETPSNSEQQNDPPQPITVTDETVTYNTEASAFILAHYPVVADSLVVKSSDGTTTYTADTDYTVTLATGTIASIEGTSMTFAENATIKVSYQYTASA